MKLAIKKHWIDFLAIAGLALVGLAIAVYLLSQQDFRFPLVEASPKHIEIELANAQAVQPGQGQTVRVAGVEVGRIADVKIEDGNSGNSVRAQINRSFVGLAGESRNFDANTPVFHIQGVNPFKLATGKLEPAPPPDANTPPPHRPDVPCETQDPPDLHAPGGDATLYGGGP